MIGVQLEPSLSSAGGDQSPGRGASAFALQSFAQSGVVIRLCPYCFAGIELALIGHGGAHRQVALTHIHPDHGLLYFWLWIGKVEFQRHQEIVLLVGLVIPEFGHPKGCSMLNQGDMVMVSFIRYNDTPLQREDTHLLPLLERVVVSIVVGDRRRDVLRGLV